jgi:hypothetical protein
MVTAKAGAIIAAGTVPNMPAGVAMIAMARAAMAAAV